MSTDVTIEFEFITLPPLPERYTIIVATIGIVNSIRISGIVFKQNDTVYRIDSNLPSVDVNNNTWTLDNSNAWTSQLTKGNCTIIVYLSGNGGNVMA
jgi:hypothetical protein